MADRPDWALGDLPMDQPSIARIWDWFLGGSHNFEIDREVARKTLELMPEAPLMAQISRAFLRRAVRYCLSRGIRQFLDLGSGIPTVGNVHEVVQGIDPDAKVVYVDRDQVAVAHTRLLLAGNDNVAVVEADIRDVGAILYAPEVRELFDFSQPVAILMIAVLHFIADAENPAGIITMFCDAVPPGSALAIAHGSSDTEGMPSESLHSARKEYEKTVAPVTLRAKSEVESLFDGFTLVDPGVTWLSEWHPDTVEPGHAADGGPPPKAGYGGVGIKASR